MSSGSTPSTESVIQNNTEENLVRSVWNNFLPEVVKASAETEAQNNTSSIGGEAAAAAAAFVPLKNMMSSPASSNSSQKSPPRIFKLIKSASAQSTPVAIPTSHHHQGYAVSSGNSSTVVASPSNPTYLLVPANIPVSKSNFVNPNAPTPYIFRLAQPVQGKLVPASKSPAGTQLYTLSRIDQPKSSTVIYIPSAVASNPVITSVPKTSNPVTKNGLVVSESNKTAKNTLTLRPGTSQATPKSTLRSTATLSTISVPKLATPKTVSDQVFPTEILSPSASGAYPEVIPILTLIPKETSWTELVKAYEATHFEARCSLEKEKKIVENLLKMKGLFDDQQVVWQQLPTPEELEIPGVSSSKIGDLLSLGRFIEILQHSYKLTRAKKRSYDFDFILGAVQIHDGKTGAYRSILNFLVWAYDERKSVEAKLHIPMEFSVSIQDLEGDHILAGETLRQYLLTLVKHKRDNFSDEFMTLLHKLRTVDIADLTVAERVDFLTTSQTILIEDTGFLPFCLTRFDSDLNQLYSEKSRITSSISSKSSIRTDNEAKLKEFDERSSTITRLEERERTRLCDEIKNNIKEIRALNESLDAIQNDIKLLQKYIAYASHSEPLGFDRNFNRYWYFPELSRDLLLEAGWFLANKSPPNSELDNSKVVSNFVFPSRPADLYQLTSKGEHKRCNVQTGYPPVSVNKWFKYPLKKVPVLIEALNTLGSRECRLKAKLESTFRQESGEIRTPPVLADSLLDIVKELFSKILADLIENQFLKENPEKDWKSKLSSSSLTELKQHILSIYRNILRPAFRKDISAVTFEEAIKETSNFSRLYYLCKILDASVAWEKQLGSVNCLVCNRSNQRSKLRRCVQCFLAFHNDGCMQFENKVCLLCRNPAARIPVKVSYLERRNSDSSTTNSSESRQTKRRQKDHYQNGEVDANARKLRRNGPQSSTLYLNGFGLQTG